jgi:tuftelin-interacting protein 11
MRTYPLPLICHPIHHSYSDTRFNLAFVFEVINNIPLAMARRKTAYLSDGSDSGDSEGEASVGAYNSQEDADSRAERALFEYNGSKRRKMRTRGGKASAWEGIFGEDEDDGRSTNRGLGSHRGRGGSTRPRSDFTR